MSNTTRQQKWQAKQRAMGRKPMTVWADDNERFVLQRILEQMREKGGVPATFRNAKGQMEHFDL